MSIAEVEAGLIEVLRPTFGAVAIADLVRLSAGANRETYAFDATDADGQTHALILQRDRAGVERLIGGCAREADVLRAVGAAGAPVAEVVVSGHVPNPLERSYTINRRLPGETIGRKLLRDDQWSGARDAFVGDCAEALAIIHSLDASGLPSVEIPDVPDALASQIAIYDALCDPHPAFDLAIRWLEANRPASLGHGLVHGDFRLGNLLLDETGLAAALDWEITHWGDPGEDLGWMCVRAWRFGGSGRVGGIGDPDAFLDAYAAASGREVSRATLHWWEVYGTLRWGTICLQLGGDFRSGRSGSVEMATIGRRVAENEYDLLNLLGESA